MKNEPEHCPEGEEVVLAGDIGGTNTHLGLYAIDAGGPRTLATVTYPSREMAGLEEMISDILRRHEMSAAAACFGIACPVAGGACRPANLDWSVSEERLRREFGWRHPAQDFTGTEEKRLYGGVYRKGAFSRLSDGRSGPGHP